jgi:hypothetical protein
MRKFTFAAGAVACLLLTLATAAVAAGGTTLPADDSLYRVGQTVPVAIKGTAAGKGLKKGAKVPKNATVEVKWIVNAVAGQETSLTIVAPRGQAIVGATSQLRSPKGKVLSTWYGTLGQGPVLIDGQFKGNAGVLVSIPENLEPPSGSVVITYALFRAGGKSKVTG